MSTTGRVPLGLGDVDFFIEAIDMHWNEWREFPSDQHIHEHVWLDQFGARCPGQVLVSVLEPLYLELCAASLGEYDPAGRAAVSSAYHLAGRACLGRLSDAERNLLGWNLTTLVALDIRVSKDILDAARRAGGAGAAASASARFSRDAAATCDAARKIIDAWRRGGRPVVHSVLVGLLQQRGHGTAPTIRARLRTQGLYPEARKKKEG